LDIPSHSLNGLYLSKFHEYLLSKLEISMLTYSYSGDEVISIQLLFYDVKYTEAIPASKALFNTDILGDKHNWIDLPKYKMELLDNPILPLTMDLNYYGTSAKLVYDESKGVIKHIVIETFAEDFIKLINGKSLKGEMLVNKETLVYISKNKK